MRMRERGAHGPRARDSLPGPMHEGIAKSLNCGTVEDKLQAILSIAARLECGIMRAESAQALLCDALTDENRQVRWSAVFAMAQHGSLMIDGLRTGLGNSDPSVRGMSAAMICVSLRNDKTALRSFMLLRNDRAVQTSCDLLKTLLDPQASVRMHALGALRELARRSPIETLDGLRAFSAAMLESEDGCRELSCRLEMVRQDALSGLIGLSGKIQA